MDVSIIIVNYNTCKMTCECIDSIVEKTHGISYEIILVDNASTDGSKEFFERDNRITYIYSEKNGGFGYGNNLGMKVARGKYLFLLNSDTLLVNNAVKEFFDYVEQRAKNVILCCYLKGKDGSDNGDYLDFPPLTIREQLTQKFRKTRTIKKIDYKEKNVDAVNGADMFLPRSAFELSGGFDESIFMYGEEVEWQYRLMLAGYERKIIPQPQIIHYGGGSSKNSKSLFSNRGYLIMLKKHASWWNQILLRMYYALANIA